MSSNATVAQGTEFHISTQGSPTSFQQVGGLVNVAPVRSNKTVEVTDYSDTHEDWLGVGVAATTLQIVYNFKDGNVGQEEMETALSDGLERECKYVYQGTPDLTYTFTAIVESITDAPNLQGIIVKTAVFKVVTKPVQS